MPCMAPYDYDTRKQIQAKLFIPERNNRGTMRAQTAQRGTVRPAM